MLCKKSKSFKTYSLKLLLIAVFDVASDRFHDKILLCFTQFAEIVIKDLQSFVIGINVIIFKIRFSEQIIGCGAEKIGNLHDLFKRRTGSADFPAAYGRLFDAQLFCQFALCSAVFFSKGFQDFSKQICKFKQSDSL